jgi:Tol biopolymer transport system component
MSDFESRLGRLHPRKAPLDIFHRAKVGPSERSRGAGAHRHLFPLFAAAGLALTIGAVLLLQPAPHTPEALRRALGSYPHKILYETHRDGNWEIYLSNADGSGARNLTQTPDVDELYPKASPDGTRICFCADEGTGEAKRRNLYLMNLDGTGRRKIADNSREPCWSADGKEIAFVQGEFEGYSVTDFATRGLFIYTLSTGQTRAHPNPRLEHLYTLNWSLDGQWFIATVHGGMGFQHSIVALEARGERVVELHVDGCCRPDLSPDGRRLAWGQGDYAIAVGDLELGDSPRVLHARTIVQSAEPMETYQVDWSPDGRFVAFSYGPKSHDHGLRGLLPEFPGVQAPGWNIAVAEVSRENVWTLITRDGQSNKEPDWLPVGPRP